MIPRPKGRGLIEACRCRHTPERPLWIPRPKGRGLIEARPRNRGRASPCRFLDRKVEASLKLGGGGDDRRGYGGRFLDRKVEASLKQIQSLLEAAADGGFLDRKVEASLKHAIQIGHTTPTLSIPRPKGRGLIEARAPAAPAHCSPGRFLDRKVEASLKPPRAVARPAAARPDSSTERSRPH